MQELIEELARATGPTFVLDREIMYAVFDVKPEHRSPGDTPKPYTASIDAAMTLVPNHTPDWDLKSAPHRRGYVALLFDPKRTFRADAATPALAICIAALLARVNK
jgi:hypothetical protein